MRMEQAVPVSVFVVGLSPRERERLLELLPSSDSHITLASALLADDGSHGEPPDLVIIDANGGAARAAQTVQRARRRWPTPPMLCLNVSDGADAVMLLDAGADDVSMSDTPFDVVSALVSAALRRVRVSNAQARIKFGDLIYDREARRVWCAGQEVLFTPRELRLFDILFLRAGNPVSADTLQDYVWSDGHAATSNALAVYIGYLRKKLRGSRISMLETLRGNGYRFVRRTD
ncbi:MAG: transcriptional regulator [Gemmatimonadetes bacterium]|nr:transcriptional regulator [Gemmatimonadota bacterium]